MSELNSFIDKIYREYGSDPTANVIVGKGYTSSILKISDKLCVKITGKNTCPDFPVSIKSCENLCVPIRTFVSPSGKYTGHIQRYVDSICLQDYIIKKKRFNEKDVSYIIFHILRGLESLHKNKLVHRDFYPGNIMVYSRDGTYGAVIIDFDETQEIKEDTRACFRFSGYHAPEIVMHDDLYDEKSEIFAVGIIMWELLFGECSFGGYDFFGAVIARSWSDYENNKTEYHRKTADALMTMKTQIKQVKGLSDECFDLLLRLLAEDKKDRILASLAVKHSFFKNITVECGG